MLAVTLAESELAAMLDADSAVAAVNAVVGSGLEGDRYFSGAGTFSLTPGGGREVTLIEAEALEALARDYEFTLDPASARRNLLTRGVPLNHLVGKTFCVGEVVLRGVRLAEPCQHLATLNDSRKVLTGLLHRGGLRADIVQGGAIRVGDSVEEIIV